MMKIQLPGSLSIAVRIFAMLLVFAFVVPGLAEAGERYGAPYRLTIALGIIYAIILGYDILLGDVKK